jgi:hypothetical protein
LPGILDICKGLEIDEFYDKKLYRSGLCVAKPTLVGNAYVEYCLGYKYEKKFNSGYSVCNPINLKIFKQFGF